MRVGRLANAAIFPKGYSSDATKLKAEKVLTHIEFQTSFYLLKSFRDLIPNLHESYKNFESLY